MLVAFVVGLLSTIHCIGMCGGLVGAMTMSLNSDIRGHKLQLLQYTLAYNIGRIVSYVFAGILIGLLGQVFKDFHNAGAWHWTSAFNRFDHDYCHGFLYCWLVTSVFTDRENRDSHMVHFTTFGTNAITRRQNLESILFWHGVGLAALWPGLLYAVNVAR